ncbi:MAG: SGNH/GDSL hydrolase family protein [Janthinobacterium lividum]
MNIVFDGDSISCGVGASPTMTLSSQTGRLLRNKSTIHVVAQGGRQLSECLDTFNQHVAALYDSGTDRNIVFLKAGDNDITRGISADTTYNRLEGYVTLAHGCGWKVIVASNLQRFDVSDDAQRELSVFNDLTIKNKAKADLIVDFASDQILGRLESRINRHYYNEDGVHPTDVGYTILAQKVASAIDQIL